MAGKLRSLISRRTIGYQIFLAMVVLICISMLLFVFTIYSTYSESLRENEIKYNILATNTIKAKFDMTIGLIQGTADTLVSNQSVLSSLDTDQAPAGTQEKISGLVHDILIMQPFIEGIHIITPDSVAYSTSPRDGWDTIRSTYAPYWQEVQIPNRHGGFWMTRSISISYICPIYRDRTRSLRGLIVMDISYDYLREMFMISAIQLNEKVLVADSTGNTLFGYPHFTSFEPFLKQYPEILSAESVQKEGKVYGIDSIIVSEKLKLADWRIIRIIQTERVTYQTRRVIDTLKIVGVLLLLACLAYSFRMTQIITRPVKILSDACSQAEQGNLNVRVNISSRDEFGKLGKTFNMMFSQLQRHLETELAEQKRKSEMQFHILQAQINPHFLYNTLDSIRWLAVLKNIGSIAEMCGSLISLLKYNLNSSDPTSTLQEELDSVKNYITIQKFRYSDNFEFSIRAAPETLSCETVRFILQPLVENSIVHGFEDVSEGYSIRIKTYLAGGLLHIKVIDNGAGMDPQQITELNSDRQTRYRFNRIGVANIRERIRLYFGKQYGVFYKSKPHVGTVAHVILPILPGEEKAEEKEEGTE
jgi:two-component system sensor histidine kinase YesM